MDLFERSSSEQTEGVPLSERMRPRHIDEVAGQSHLLGKDKLLGRAIRHDRVPSMVLWGPPGVGKTTLARVIAKETQADFVPFSAVLGGVPELRKILAEAKEKKTYKGRRTILFVDEIHRFNKAQQDALLPHVENGTVVLIGATTENPSFAVNAALLSRARVFALQPLSPDELLALLNRALSDTARGLGQLGLTANPSAMRLIAEGTQGDARRGLDVLEAAANYAATGGQGHVLDDEAASQALAGKTVLYDRNGEEHYNVVSAFIKSMRGSDPDAAIYYMMRMIEAGEDPQFVLRRMVIFASEDIGNADPRALELAVSADAAFQRLGMPEGLFGMAQCCTYLASAPKSNASYRAFTQAREDVRTHGALPVPMKLRNAPTKAMKSWGYGDGYRYPHNEGGYAAGESYLPEKLQGSSYYAPTQEGFEARIKARLDSLRPRGKTE